MVRVINQDTFDDAVKENISEFGMDVEEAIADAVKQFEAQGVDLGNIIKDMTNLTTSNTEELNEVLDKLSKFAKELGLVTPLEIIEQLHVLKNECDKGLPNRVCAGKQGAYDVLLDIISKANQSVDVIIEGLKTLTSLMTKQPDLLNDSGVQLMTGLLTPEQDYNVQMALLRWIKECCAMHENNRQNIFNAQILEYLKPILEKADSLLLRNVLGVLRALVLDDDVRVEFGRAHEHARAIASDALCIITQSLTKFKEDELLVNDILLTLSSLLVRTEFCKEVEDVGGLDTIRDTMIIFQTRNKLMRQCFKVLKALAGNDEVKIHIIQKHLAPIILSAVNVHKNSSATATLGLSCIAALTLRCPENSKAFFEAGAPEVIIDCMKLHPDDAGIQKNASWAIRNMVSRSNYQCNKFLEMGVESILKINLKKFVQHEFDTKSALMVLGCKVKLREEWTGKGGRISTQAKNE
ncbi:hypothetical protein FQA39_LY04937 [Lamprigera yunnana]|nr:hypothetical protein FQA39_LY04937 [Lamprigera yunnana]